MGERSPAEAFHTNPLINPFGMPPLKDGLKDKLAHLPTTPGVYQHKDVNGKVLYVGKAKNLRTRVRSYFRTNANHDGRLQALVRKIEDVEVIVTDTEAEALLLENNLIKELKPRYNINLRDDKTYPFICIKNERFPRIFPTRRVVRDGSKYFGPYTEGRSLKLMLDTIRTMFKVRTCSYYLSEGNIKAGKFKPCLEYHINNCLAPCVGYETETHYNDTIAQIEQLLSGHTRALIDHLKADMQNLAAEMRFEEAGELRDRIMALEKYSAKQKMVTTERVDRDLFALERDPEYDVACGVLFTLREGKIVGRRHKYLHRIEGRSIADLMQSFVEDYYTEAVFFPDAVYLSSDLQNPEPVMDFLHEKRGKKVEWRTPERGEKAELMRMVEANARLLLDEFKLARAKQEEGRIPHSVKALQRDLHLKHLPRRIECFDISHLAGTGTVASCVVFEDGRPKKRDYRTFKIRSVEGKPDDFQSMREVVGRRYRRTLEENGPWPDLIVIDGGKGQLSSAVEILKQNDVYGKTAVIGLAKRLEEVFFPGDKDPVLIPKTSPSLRLLQRVRDEAHRFAITFQRKQRAQVLRSELLDIPGIGEKTVRKLLKHFGSVRKVKAAQPEEVAQVAGPAVAHRITKHYSSP